MNHPSTLIIAEAGVNHNGSLERAKRMVESAADSGADAVKFQTFQASKLATGYAAKAEYQICSTGAEKSQQDLLRMLELTAKEFVEIAHCCKNNGIEFMSTAFDSESLSLLLELGIKRIKIPSGEMTNAVMLYDVAKVGLPIILSTGMCTLGEVETSLAYISMGMIGMNPENMEIERAFTTPDTWGKLEKSVTILHCTTEYPAPFEEVNLRAMDVILNSFGLPVGYSDHTVGIAVPIAAVARGAVMIEKHFTLDRSLPGPDHMASLEPDELGQLVVSIRQVETSLGSSRKCPSPRELGTRENARKSIVAARRISKGDVLSSENLALKRPGKGLPPALYWSILGRVAEKDFDEDEPISL